MPPTIVPFARAVYLCDSYIGYGNGNVDLYGVFTSIRAVGGFPYRHGRLSVFVQLSNGLGRAPYFIEIRDASDESLVWMTATRELVFPDRRTVVRLAHTIEGCVFERAGLYSAAVFCNNQWVCDNAFWLQSPQ